MAKETRINLALTQDNYDFVKASAAARDETMTGFINYVIELYRQDHREGAEKALALIRELEDLKGQL